MSIDTKRLWKAIGIGVLCTLPILYVYIAGEGSEDTALNVMASALMVPGMIFAVPLLFLAPFFEDPDRYVLGAFFYSIPFASVVFYVFCAYVVLSIIPRKK